MSSQAPKKRKKMVMIGNLLSYQSPSFAMNPHHPLRGTFHITGTDERSTGQALRNVGLVNEGRAHVDFMGDGRVPHCEYETQAQIEVIKMCYSQVSAKLRRTCSDTEPAHIRSEYLYIVYAVTGNDYI